jgi:hypothetical protein
MGIGRGEVVLHDLPCRRSWVRRNNVRELLHQVASLARTPEPFC